MNKTLLKNFTAKHHAHAYEGIIKTAKNDDVLSLLCDMQSYLNEAASDLLQPRPSAIADLLKRAQEHKS